MIDYLAQNLWTLWAVLAMVCLVLELSSGVLGTGGNICRILRVVYILHPATSCTYA